MLLSMYSKLLSCLLRLCLAVAHRLALAKSELVTSLPLPIEPRRNLPPPPPPAPDDVPEYAVGRACGRAEGQSELMLKLLSLRFGALQSDVRRQVRAASWDDLQRVSERLFTASTLEQALGLGLGRRSGLGTVRTMPMSGVSNIEMVDSKLPPLPSSAALDAAFARPFLRPLELETDIQRTLERS